MFLAWRMSKTQSRWQNQMAYVLFLKTNPIFSDENAFKFSIINIKYSWLDTNFEACSIPIFQWQIGNTREKLRGGDVADNTAPLWNSETVAGTIYWHTATQADPSSRQSRRSTSPTQGDWVGPSLPSLHLLLWQDILCLHPERYWDRSQVITDSLCCVSRLWHSAAVSPWPLSWCHQDTLPGESDTNMMNNLASWQLCKLDGAVCCTNLEELV